MPCGRSRNASGASCRPPATSTSRPLPRRPSTPRSSTPPPPRPPAPPIFPPPATYPGPRTRPIPPVLTVDEVAAGIEACAEKPKQEVNYGRSGRILEILYALAPGLYRRLAHRAFVRGTMSAARAESTSGSVLAPAEPHEISGHWRRRRP